MKFLHFADASSRSWHMTQNFTSLIVPQLFLNQKLKISQKKPENRKSYFLNSSNEPLDSFLQIPGILPNIKTQFVSMCKGHVIIIYFDIQEKAKITPLLEIRANDIREIILVVS
jgi:hypothetical protein